MSANKDSATLEGLVREILGVAREVERARAGALQDIENDFKSIARRDYVGCLSGHFSRRDLNGILAAVEARLPSVNREQFKLMPLPRLTKFASEMGLELRTEPFDGPGGTALRGFYVESKALKQPLICLNSDHHQTAINSAFWHEMGHHLTARLLRQRERLASLSFGGDYHEHLSDPMELVADMVVVLVVYPNSTARDLFAARRQRGPLDDIQQVLSAARNHIKSLWGFNFDRHIPPNENLHYLAGMIHYAKLRLALLAEYDI